MKNNGNYVNVTSLIGKLSERHRISPSTLRWNVNCLHKLGLINCGTYQKKGIPAKLTDSGLVVQKILNWGCSSRGEHSAEDRGVRSSSLRSPNSFIHKNPKG